MVAWGMPKLPEVDPAVTAVTLLFHSCERAIVEALGLHVETRTGDPELRAAIYDYYLSLRRAEQRLRSAVVARGIEGQSVPAEWPPRLEKSTPSRRHAGRSHTPAR
jgi:hypothetical protein